MSPASIYRYANVFFAKPPCYASLAPNINMKSLRSYNSTTQWIINKKIFSGQRKAFPMRIIVISDVNQYHV